MAQVMLWNVLREHEGDRKYAEGETREGLVVDLGHLDGTVLDLIGPKPDDKPLKEDIAADPPPAKKSEGASGKNKAEGASPATKTITNPRRKTRK